MIVIFIVKIIILYTALLPEHTVKQSDNDPDHCQQNINPGSYEQHITYLGTKFRPRTVIGDDSADIDKESQDKTYENET